MSHQGIDELHQVLDLDLGSRAVLPHLEVVDAERAGGDQHVREICLHNTLGSYLLRQVGERRTDTPALKFTFNLFYLLIGVIKDVHSKT